MTVKLWDSSAANRPAFKTSHRTKHEPSRARSSSEIAS